MGQGKAEGNAAVHFPEQADQYLPSEAPSWRDGVSREVPCSALKGETGVPSRRRLTPRGSLECNPEIPAFPGEEY